MEIPFQLATANVPVGSLDAYIYRVEQIPMLSAEEEIFYAKKLRETEDLESARQLVMAHLRYVVRIARGYRGYGLALGDLIQEGNVGLMKAVKRFDPEVGVRLASFAIHWIKAEIHDFVLKNWRIVKIATTKAQRKLFFNMRQMKKRLGWMKPEEVEAMANDLGVSTKEVLVMEQRLTGAPDMPYDGMDLTPEDDGVSRYMPALYLQAENSDPARLAEVADSGEQHSEQLYAAMAQLDERSQDILKQRWLAEPGSVATLHDLAAIYNISAERVRQLEKNALLKLKKHMEMLVA